MNKTKIICDATLRRGSVKLLGVFEGGSPKAFAYEVHTTRKDAAVKSSISDPFFGQAFIAVDALRQATEAYTSALVALASPEVKDVEDLELHDQFHIASSVASHALYDGEPNEEIVTGIVERRIGHALSRAEVDAVAKSVLDRRLAHRVVNAAIANTRNR